MRRLLGACTSTVWINEIHYDNTGADAGEFVEVAGPANLDVFGWTVVGYNGNGGAPYNSIILADSLSPSGGSGSIGVLAVDFLGLQNGAPDGIALVDLSGNVCDFISYGGPVITANDPQAPSGVNGRTSVDIEATEDEDSFYTQSLGRTDDGSSAAGARWSLMFSTPGAENRGQRQSPHIAIVPRVVRYRLCCTFLNSLPTIASPTTQVAA